MSRPDPHYFLGKTEILDWLNSTLSLNLQKVEDTSNGAVACQLMDAIHRSQGGVSLKQVDFNAKTEYDSLNNYKVLQQAFLKYGVQKSADSAKLVKGKPLDNLEFMQWFKSYFDKVTNNGVITDYDGEGRRATSKTGSSKVMGSGGPRKIPTAPTHAPAAYSAAASSVAAKAEPVPTSAPAQAPAARRASSSTSKPSVAHDGVLAAELAEARGIIDLMDKEKSFYYSKLRDIELFCQTPVICDIPVMKRVEAILYSATSEEGRKKLIDAQIEFSGKTFLEEDEAAAQAAADHQMREVTGEF